MFVILILIVIVISTAPIRIKITIKITIEIWTLGGLIPFAATAFFWHLLSPMNTGRKALIFFTLLAGAVAVSAETSSRLHWLGRQQLAAETNAARFMDIWKLPESARLEAQLLNKLAGATNAAAAGLRPLLDDLVQAESYAEVRHATNQPGQLAFAIRISETRARWWETNLPSALDGFEVKRAGGWTLVGKATGANALLAEWRERIAKTGSPAAKGATNFWLEADVDLPQVARVFGWKLELPAGWPRIFLTLTGDGENVLTRGTLDFAKPLDLKLEPWSIPTNLIREPLIGFAAVRGVGAALTESPFWKGAQIGASPEQMFFWAQASMPFEVYFAGLLPDATNRVERLSERLLAGGNDWAATNRMGSFERMPGGHGVLWKNVPFMTPFMQSLAIRQKEYAFGGLFGITNTRTNATLPAALLTQVASAPYLVLYDWEMTGPRMESWLHIGQLFRLIFHKPQLPAKSVSLDWLRTVAFKLKNTVTVVTLPRPSQLAFSRKSTAGFTALELHLLADWAESPDFPKGLHTFKAAPDGGFGAKRPLPSEAMPKK